MMLMCSLLFIAILAGENNRIIKQGAEERDKGMNTFCAIFFAAILIVVYLKEHGII